MEKNIPSIFNDVIGPVMRGPSSSHCAASSRIGRIIHMATKGTVKKAEFDFDIKGSLAATYDGQGSDIGLVSGLLGIDLVDPDMVQALDIAKKRGVDISFNILDYGAVHPNNYRMRITSEDGESHTWEAISTGGGMMVFERLDEFSIDIRGDYYELIIIVPIDNSKELEAYLKEHFPACEVFYKDEKEKRVLFNIKDNKPFDEKEVLALEGHEKIEKVMSLSPVLLTLSSTKIEVPFETSEELLKFAEDSDREMWEMATLYESRRGNVSEEEVFEQMAELVDIFENSVKEGLAGTEYEDRILHQQSHLIREGMERRALIPNDLINQVIQNITAVMEVKSSMGVIIAAPTAGSCGVLPGTITALSEVYSFSKEDMVKAMLAAGLVGVFFAKLSTFAAEVAGCQVECGAGSGMTAAAVAQLFGGSVEECINAASIALQGITGLVCDTVANRVEVPCLSKNIMAGANAIFSANMALAGFDPVIPLDETIEAIYDIGLQLPSELRCTCGGLGKTKTAMELREKLERCQVRTY